MKHRRPLRRRPVIAPEVGGQYVLRNGATVKIVRKVNNPGFTYFIGEYVDPEVFEHYTCGEDGHYAPTSGVRPHELDIVRRA